MIFQNLDKPLKLAGLDIRFLTIAVVNMAIFMFVMPFIMNLFINMILAIYLNFKYQKVNFQELVLKYLPSRFLGITKISDDRKYINYVRNIYGFKVETKN